MTHADPGDTVSGMRTTLDIDDAIMARLKKEAARQGCTMSEVVETALRLLFRTRRGPRRLRPLPSWHMGAELLDIADRDALHRVMEEP